MALKSVASIRQASAVIKALETSLAFLCSGTVTASYEQRVRIQHAIHALNEARQSLESVVDESLAGI